MVRGTLCAIVALCGASCAKTYVCDVTVYWFMRAIFGHQSGIHDAFAL